ncbi:hypothetical protein TWF694_000873 [Orbilia ellipsospora]|uniref:Uncharacterized protein n=1 Tax=Orbilia ellipsospora TaxID=2528407 RepID=A0AAV9XRD3_9PEZI
MEDGRRPPVFDISDLPAEVADELAAFLRSHLSQSHDTFYPTLLTTHSTTLTTHKDTLRDIQSQISNVILPTSDSLLPIAQDLKSTFDQIDRLEHLVTKIIAPQIKDLSAKLDKTEQLVRWEEKALVDGKRVELWKGVDMGDVNERRVFRADDYFDGKSLLKDVKQEGGNGSL